VAPTRLPGVSWLLDRVYGTFARNRIWLGHWVGRPCENGACAVKSADREVEVPSPAGRGLG
jgi:predicted DCC family thiol-disulfide oxidoreductase YuxK